MDFGLNTQQDEMRMRLVGRKSTCHFDARVAGLNGLLSKWQVATNKHVNVGVKALTRVWLRVAADSVASL